MDVFSNLQSLLNLILKFRVTHYLKSVIRTIIIEYNKILSKKPLSIKNPFFYGKTPAQWVKWVHTQANPDGDIPRPTLIGTVYFFYKAILVMWFASFLSIYSYCQ